MQEYEELENYPEDEIPIVSSNRNLTKRDIQRARVARVLQREELYEESFPSFRPTYYPYLDEKGNIDVSKISKYDQGAPPMDLYGYYDINKYRGYQQSTINQFGSAINQMVIGELVGGTLEGVGSILALPQIMGGDYDINNPIFKIGKSLINWSRETTPIYQTGERFADTGYWFQGLVSVGSAASFLLPGWAIMKGVKTLGKVAGLPRITGEAAAIGASSLYSRHTEGLREANDLYDRNVEKLTSIWNTGQFPEEIVDNNKELYGLYKEKETSIGKIIEGVQRGVIPEEDAEVEIQKIIEEKDSKAQSLIRTYANMGARTTYLLDYVNLMFDIAQFGALSKIFQKTSRAIGQKVPDKLLGVEKGIIGMKEVAEQSIPKTWYGKIFSKAYQVGKDIFPQASEGLEEVWNEVASNEGERVMGLTSGIIEDDGSNFLQRVQSYLDKPETVDAFIFGTLGGVAFQSIGNVIGFGGDKDLVNRKIKETVSREKSLKNMVSEITTIMGNPKLTNEAKNDRIQDLAYKTGFEIGINASLNNNMDRVEKHLKSPELVKDFVNLKMGDEKSVSTITNTVWEGARAAETNFNRYFSLIRERRFSDSSKVSLATNLASLHDHVIKMGKEKASVVSKIREYEEWGDLKEMTPLERLLVREMGIGLALKETQEHGKDSTLDKDTRELHFKMEEYLKKELDDVVKQINTLKTELSNIPGGSKEVNSQLKQINDSFKTLIKKGLAEYTSVYYLIQANEQIHKNRLSELMSEEEQKKYAKDFDKKAEETQKQQVEKIKETKYKDNKTKAKETQESKKTKESGEVKKPGETIETSDTPKVSPTPPVSPPQEPPKPSEPLKTPTPSEPKKEVGQKKKIEEEPKEKEVKEKGEPVKSEEEPTDSAKETTEVVKDMPDGIIEDTPYEIIGTKVYKEGKELENPESSSVFDLVIDDFIKDYQEHKVTVKDYLKISDKISKIREEYSNKTKVDKEKENIGEEYNEQEESEKEELGNSTSEESFKDESVWIPAKSPFAIRLAYKATNTTYVDGKAYTIKGQEGIPQPYIDLADWTSFPIGTQVEFELDTEYRGKGYVYENGRRIGEREETFKDFEKEGKIEFQNVPIKVWASYPDGRRVIIGYIPTMNFITELDNYNNYKNILTEGRKEEEVLKEINKLRELRYSIVNSGRKVTATIDKYPGHLLIYHEKDSEGNIKTVSGTISELLPNLISEDVLKTYYGKDLYPVTVYKNGAFIMVNGQGGRSFPHKNISLVDPTTMKGLKNGMTVLMLPSAIPGKFHPIISYPRHMKEDFAGGLTEVVRAGILAKSHPERLSSKHKELIDTLASEGFNITSRAGLKRYLQKFIYVANVGIRMGGSNTIIAFNPKESIIEIHSEGKVETLNLNKYDEIEKNLSRLKETFQKMVLGIEIQNTSLNTITIPSSLEPGTIDFHSTPYMKFMFDNLQTIANEIKNSNGIPVYSAQPTIIFSNINLNENSGTPEIVEKSTKEKKSDKEKLKSTDIDSFLNENTPPNILNDNKFKGGSEEIMDITIETDESIQETVEKILIEKDVISKDFRSKEDKSLDDEGEFCTI